MEQGSAEHCLQTIEEDLRCLFDDSSKANPQSHAQAQTQAQTQAQWQAHLRQCMQAHQYPLAAGGKRVRPVLLLALAHALGGENALLRARPSACAIELVHTYSLVHDDLPCMDNDNLRRGKPTTHRVYGDDKALLVGDGLLTHAFSLLSSRGAHPPWNSRLTTCEEALWAVELLAAAAGPAGMVGGQWIDISGGQWQQNDLLTLHTLKTGKLLGAALALGTLHGLGSSLGQIPALNMGQLVQKAQESGELVGLAFQIVDDIIDVESNAKTLGKTQGKDASQGKVTAVDLLGLQNAKSLAAQYSTHAQELLMEVFHSRDEVFGTAGQPHNKHEPREILTMISELLGRKS